MIRPEVDRESLLEAWEDTIGFSTDLLVADALSAEDVDG